MCMQKAIPLHISASILLVSPRSYSNIALDKQGDGFAFSLFMNEKIRIRTFTSEPAKILSTDLTEMGYHFGLSGGKMIGISLLSYARPGQTMFTDFVHFTASHFTLLSYQESNRHALVYWPSLQPILREKASKLNYITQVGLFLSKKNLEVLIQYQTKDRKYRSKSFLIPFKEISLKDSHIAEIHEMQKEWLRKKGWVWKENNEKGEQDVF